MATADPNLIAPAGAFASSDPGFEAVSVHAILGAHQALLGRIKLCFGADRAAFDRDLMPLIQGYARFVHLLPATADNYFRAPGGLLQLGLEAAFFSLQGTDAHIISGRATISERREIEPRWRIATFIGGLCCDLHRTLSHLIVTTAEGEEWPPFLGGLTPWLEQRSSDRYFVRWRSNARESRGLGLFALPHVIPAQVMQMLGDGNSIVVPQLMASIAGVPQYREHNVLDELVRRSMALVVDRNLLASADRYGKPQYGSHLERYLVDALRRLAAGHSAWTPNRDKSRVWIGPEGLFLVWPGAAEDVLSLLETDQLTGIPKSPHTLLELLLEAGVFVSPDSSKQTWSIQPPGAKAAIDAVRLANAAILLTGLDPAPAPLTASLLPSDPSISAPEVPAQTAGANAQAAGPQELAARSAAKAPSASTPTAPAAQLSLLEKNAPPEGRIGDSAASSVPSVSPPADPPNPNDAVQAVPSTVALKAPLRLDPAVRRALAEIVSTLSDGARSSQVCAVAEGVFIPLDEFERRGVQPSIAIRALKDTRMIWRPTTSGPPTVRREVREAPVLGVVLASAHVEDLDPRALASVTEEADALSVQRTPPGIR